MPILADGLMPNGPKPLNLNIRAAAEKALTDTLKNDEKRALVMGASTVDGQTSIHAGWAEKIGDTWTLSDDFGWDKAAGLHNEFMIVGAWK